MLGARRHSTKGDTMGFLMLLGDIYKRSYIVSCCEQPLPPTSYICNSVFCELRVIADNRNIQGILYTWTCPMAPEAYLVRGFHEVLLDSGTPAMEIQRDSAQCERNVYIVRWTGWPRSKRRDS
jgi:hypothetical protein